MGSGLRFEIAVKVGSSFGVRRLSPSSSLRFLGWSTNSVLYRRRYQRFPQRPVYKLGRPSSHCLNVRRKKSERFTFQHRVANNENELSLFAPQQKAFVFTHFRIVWFKVLMLRSPVTPPDWLTGITRPRYPSGVVAGNPRARAHCRISHPGCESC